MGDVTPAHVALVGHRLAEAHPTGIGRYYAEIATALAATADHRRRYTVASTREAGPPPWAPPGLVRHEVPGPRRARALLWGTLRRPAADRPLGRPDLVHVLHPWVPVPTRAPLVATVHDLMPMLHPEWHGRLEHWLFTRGAAHVAERAERILVDSRHVAEVVTAHLDVGPDRLRVVEIGVGDEFRRRPGPERVAAVCARHGVAPGHFLCAVGAVSARKNLVVVLRALARLDPERFGDVTLLAAGPAGRGAEAVREEAERLGLSGRVRFAGFVDHDELPVLVGASRALVHPSRDEGFGLTPLEAMAAGVPAVASTVGSIPEMTGTAALLADPDDVDGWAAHLAVVLGDDDRHAALVAAGTEQQARFTWARTAAATRAVHDEVLR